MKVETRGKFPGVKVHLDEEECQYLLAVVAEGKVSNFASLKYLNPAIHGAFSLAYKMGQKVEELLAAEPTLLEERTPEQIAAILAKESEKAAMQLKALQSGAEWKKVDPDALNAAMSKLVNKQ